MPIDERIPIVGEYCKVTIIVENPDGSAITIAFEKTESVTVSTEWHEPISIEDLMVPEDVGVKEFNVKFKPLLDEDGTLYTETIVRKR